MFSSNFLSLWSLFNKEVFRFLKPLRQILDEGNVTMNWLKLFEQYFFRCLLVFCHVRNRRREIQDTFALEVWSFFHTVDLHEEFRESQLETDLEIRPGGLRRFHHRPRTRQGRRHRFFAQDGLHALFGSQDGGVGGPRGVVGGVAIASGAGEGRVFPAQLVVLLELFIRNVQRHVRNDGRIIEEEGPVFIGADEFQRLLIDPVGRVILSLEDVVAAGIFGVGAFWQRGVPWNGRLVVEGDPHLIAPEVGGVVAVGVALAVVAEEPVEALVDGISLGSGSSEPPFSEGSGSVAAFFESLGDGLFGIGDGPLALGLDLSVVTDKGVAGVFPGDQDAARGGADGIAAVVAGKAHTLFCKAIKVRGADSLLSVAAEFGVAQVICQDKDNVGLSLCSRGTRQHCQQETGGDGRLESFQVHSSCPRDEKLKKQAGAWISKSPRHRLFSGNSFC